MFEVNSFDVFVVEVSQTSGDETCPSFGQYYPTALYYRCLKAVLIKFRDQFTKFAVFRYTIGLFRFGINLGRE
jgi:hypothetical protein